MRQGNSGTVSFLLGDHLGSTSLTANSSGSKVAELRYHPWGGTRYTSGVTPTSYQFTGQKNDAAIGLYFYNARYYDPYLNRFIQADTIVPSPANPQSLNRYAYVLNSPLNYIDPSGHREVRYTEGEWITQEVFSEYAGEWDIAKQARNRAIIEAIFGVADTVAAILWEPYDWASTGVRCTQGGCNALDYAGFLPLIPGALGRVDDVARAANKIENGSEIGSYIYRKASGTADSLTPRPGSDDLDLLTGGLSFFDNTEDMNRATPLGRGDKYVVVDPEKLGGLDVVYDNNPPGHVTVRPSTLEALKEWASTKGTGIVHKFTEIVINALAGPPRKW